MERAYYGWNGNIQIETLDILQEKGWINLYLDGLRKAPKGFTVARNVEEALSIMQHNKIHILSLDHDLGMDEKGNLLQTGYDLVKIMCQRGLRANKIYLHTSNVVGREAMYETLRASQRRGFIDDDIKIYFTENSFTDC
nr:cyclic-phosphate processing receiver domain-containing protein [Lederbergia galactosidilytica]